MKKYLILVMIAVFITGCSGGDGSSNSDSTTSTGAQGDPFIGGTEGLMLEFLSGAPPAEVFDQETYPFDINLKVENVGEYDIATGSASFSIVGIDPADFGKTGDDLKAKLSEDLNGAHRDAQGNDLPGTIGNIEFNGLNFKDKITGTPEFIIRANACYTYGTEAITQLCILEDLIGRTRKSGEEPFCEANEEKDVHNSGGPLQIANFRQNVAGKDKVSFTFNIENQGKEEIRISEKGSSCNIEIAKKDRVWVEVDTGIDGTTCSGLTGGLTSTEGFVKLFGERGGSEERAVFCAVPLGKDRSDFLKQAHVKLEYDIRDYIEKPLIVKHTE